MRVKAVIEYDGAKFNGFQIQKHTSKTVTETLLSVLNSLGIKTKVVGSGRTDKGVHASFQVIHFDLPSYWQEKTLLELQLRLNQKLQHIRVKYITKVEDSFHAQYNAKVRVYRYIIKTKEPSVFEKEYVSFYPLKDYTLFEKAIKAFEGEHNFKFFKKEGSLTSSDIRTIYKTKIIKKKGYIIVYFFANGYLRNQIRLMIAAALAVEQKKLTLEKLQEQIEAKKRYITKAALPYGLYLARVFY